MAAQVVALGYFSAKSFFYFDDYIYFREAQREGLSLRFLARPLNVHVAPAHRFADWFLQRWFPLNFGVAQALLLACFAGSVLVLYRVLTELSRPGPGPVLLTLLYGTSIVHVGAAQWWSSGLQLLPSTLLSLVSILAYIRFFRTGSPRMLAASVGAFSVGLLFYVKPVLVPLYLVLIRVLLLEPERPVRDSVAQAAREWRVWVLHLLPVGLYLTVYVSRYWQRSATPSLALVGDYLRISWVRTFVPSFLGFHVAGDATAGGGQAGLLAAQALVGAVVVWSVLRNGRAWRAWVFFAVAFVANALLVGLPRLSQWGAGIAHFYRYYPEATYLLPIALAAAFLPAGRAPAGPAPGRGPGAGPAGRRRVVALSLGAVAVGAHLAVAGWSAQRVAEEAPGFRSGPYMRTVRHELARVERSGARPAILDGTVPDYVVASWAVFGPPYSNRYSELFPLMDAKVAFDRLDRPLFTVAGHGALRPVAFRPVAGGPPAQLLRGGILGVTAATVEDGGGGLCLSSGAEPASVELALPTPLLGGPWYLALRYSTEQRRTLAVLADRGLGYPSPPDRSVTLTRGPGHSALVSLGPSRLDRVRLDLPPRWRGCLQRLEVGRLVPRS